MYHKYPYNAQIPILIDGKYETRTFTSNEEVWDVIHLLIAETKENRIEALNMLNNGQRVAAVYDHKQDLPEFQIFKFNGKTYKFPVIDADSTDLRFNDPGSVICGLKAKGRAKNSETGFVLYNNQITIN